MELQQFIMENIIQCSLQKKLYQKMTFVQKINRITFIYFNRFWKIWGETKISFTEKSQIKYSLHYFALYRIDISVKSDFQKDLLLLKTLSQDLQNFHQFIFKWSVQARDFIVGKTNKSIKKKMFCSNISYLASLTSSPSVKSIVLAMQYLKGTLHSILPLSLAYTCTSATAQIEFDQNSYGKESRNETIYC